MSEIDVVRRALSGFAGVGEGGFELRPFGAGRIHRTFAVVDAGRGEDGRGGDGRSDRARAGEPRYLLQQINLAVFPDYERLMRNAVTISRHLGSPLEFIPAADGSSFVRDDEGRVWRLLAFVTGSVPASIPPSLPEAREAALAFGEFDAALASLPPSAIAETIPGFHDTPARYRRLQRAAAAPATDVLAAARESLDRLASRADRLGFIADNLGSDELPLRVCHNDTKADNVLLHRDTGRRLCVVDYDTVMPGSPVYDVGDLLRSAAPTVGEDHPEPADVDVRWDAARTIVDAFLEGAGSALTETERRLAPAGGWLLAVEQAIRYLTDYLEGEHYYPVEYEGQSLDRARNQVALAVGFERGGWGPPG